MSVDGDGGEDLAVLGLPNVHTPRRGTRPSHLPCGRWLHAHLHCGPFSVEPPGGVCGVPPAPCSQAPRTEPALSRSGHVESPAGKKGRVCSGRSPASPAGALTEFWQQLPARGRAVSKCRRELPTSAWGRGGHASLAGSGAGALCLASWPGPGAPAWRFQWGGVRGGQTGGCFHASASLSRPPCS